MEFYNPTYEWKYCANPNSDYPILDINMHIGNDPIDGDGIIGSTFVKEITMLDNMGKKQINIYFNSPGGSVFDGHSICTAILRCKTPTYGFVGGWAISIAGVMFQCCDNRIMLSFSGIMVHNPSLQNEDTTVEEDPILKLYKEGLMTLLLAHPKLTRGKLDTLMSEETWMDAETALKLGFCDEILQINEEIEPVNTQYIQNNTNEIKNNIAKYSLVMNKVKTKIVKDKEIADEITPIKNKNTKMILELKKVLNLADTATDKEVLAASLKFIEDKVKNDPDDDDDDDDDTRECDDKITKAVEDDCNPKMGDDCDMDMKNDDDKDEIVNLKKENAKLKKEMANLKNAINKEKAVTAVNNFVKLGKIKNDKIAIDKWVNMFIADFELSKSLVEDLPVNRTAVKINTVDGVGVKSGAGQYDAVSRKMAELENKMKANNLPK
jgi:ATP-dependent protease ClpP protease subunit